MKLLKLDIKTYMIIFLSILGILSIWYINSWNPGTGFLIATKTLVMLSFALLLDGLIIWKKEHKLKFSQSACITGLIIAELLAYGQPWFIYIFTPLFAISSKYIIKISKRHIFNPAAFGLFVSQLLFSAQLVWWAAHPQILLIIFGLFIVYKMKRWELVLSFLVANAFLLFAEDLIKNKSLSLYLLNAINCYFMFFMLTEPKTQASSRGARIIYAGLIGTFSFILLGLPKFDFSILSLLLGNLTVPILNKWLR